MFGERFKRELDMIDSALTTEEGEIKMRKELKPFVESIVDKYVLDNNIKDTNREKLIDAGWSHFHIALKRYKGRTELMLLGKNDIYYFNTYFNWYVRQGVLEYLKSVGINSKKNSV